MDGESIDKARKQMAIWVTTDDMVTRLSRLAETSKTEMLHIAVVEMMRHLSDVDTQEIDKARRAIGVWATTDRIIEEASKRMNVSKTEIVHRAVNEMAKEYLGDDEISYGEGSNDNE